MCLSDLVGARESERDGRIIVSLERNFNESVGKGWWWQIKRFMRSNSSLTMHRKVFFSFEKLMENFSTSFATFSPSLKFRFMTFLIFHHPRNCAFCSPVRSMTVRQQKAIVILLWYLNSISHFILNPVRQRGTSDCVWFFVCCLLSISLGRLFSRTRKTVSRFLSSFTHCRCRFWNVKDVC